MPERIHREAMSTGDNLWMADFSAEGSPRAMVDGWQPWARAPVVIQIQALDSRSFLDRSAEIAAAVKDAILHSHSLQDVMRE
ncbi:MAG: hypothetical protein NZV14_07965 [Bryobacteraceae bacterium]|nr:hypothetical protein [Bryobacteraceae bacterium]MDW8378082.1 hypothetical protein [Bryobacterales bacterium]